MWESQGSQNWPQGMTLKEVMKKNLLITSPNKYLNLFVGGGFHEGMITQLYGEAGSGKTQTAMLFALGAISKNLKVGYLATEKQLHFGRFTQLAYNYMNEAEYEECESNIFYKKTTDPTLGQQFIEETLAQIKQTERGGLLIIDSIYSFINAYIEGLGAEGDSVEKSRRQAELVNRIRAMAKVARVAVVMINQAVDCFDGRRSFGGSVVPALGPSWDLNMDETIEISRKAQIREIRIINSPKCKANNKQRFRITSQGFIWISEDGVQYQ